MRDSIPDPISSSVSTLLKPLIDSYVRALQRYGLDPSEIETKVNALRKEFQEARSRARESQQQARAADTPKDRLTEHQREMLRLRIEQGRSRLQEEPEPQNGDPT